MRCSRRSIEQCMHIVIGMHILEMSFYQVSRINTYCMTAAASCSSSTCDLCMPAPRVHDADCPLALASCSDLNLISLKCALQRSRVAVLHACRSGRRGYVIISQDARNTWFFKKKIECHALELCPRFKLRLSDLDIIDAHDLAEQKNS